MQHGKLVEHGPAQRVLEAPEHPYTRALLAAVPDLAPAPARRDFDGDPVALKVSGLQKAYRGKGLFRGAARVVHAAKDVALQVRRGETVGIVGESGSGKSTVARCIARLVPLDAGEIQGGDIDSGRLSQRALRRHRKRIQMVFQDPYGSLDPRQTVASLIAEGPMIHGATAEDARRRALELLALVGLDARSADRFPHEFSGGQRQR